MSPTVNYSDINSRATVVIKECVLTLYTAITSLSRPVSDRKTDRRVRTLMGGEKADTT